MNKNLRIIHTVPSIAVESAGPSYSISRLCESLLDRNVDVILTTLRSANQKNTPSYLKTFESDGVPKKLGRSTLMQRWLGDAAKNGEVDILHNHSLWMMPNVYPSWVAKKYNIPIIISPRGTLSEAAMSRGFPLKMIFWHAIQRKTLETASCFHATADSEYEDIRRLGFKQPVAIIPNGIDIPLVERKLSSSRRKLLFLGRLHPIKGINLLIEAWVRLSRRFPDWDLDIVGPDNGGYQQELIAMVRRLNVERVHFKGELSGAAKHNAYASSDLYILPSFSENFGVTVAEAYAAGTPAVVTKGTPWAILEKEHAGWWVDISVDGITAALEEAMSMPRAELERRGAVGRRLMIDDFGWAEIGQKMHQTYEWLMNLNAKPDCVHLK